MFRRSALPSAAASLAVILLAAAGCKVQVGSAAQASAGAGPAASPGVTQVGSLIIEPAAGFSPVYNLIKGARHSIDMTMYEFTDTTAECDLAKGGELQPRLAPRCRFAVHRPGSPVASPRSRGMPCRGFVLGSACARLFIADMFDYTTMRREGAAFPPGLRLGSPRRDPDDHQAGTF